MFVAHVRDVDLHLPLKAGDIEEVAAVFGDEAVHEGDRGPQLDQAPGQVCADKPKTPGDQDPAAVKSLLKVHGLSTSDPRRL